MSMRRSILSVTVLLFMVAPWLVCALDSNAKLNGEVNSITGFGLKRVRPQSTTQSTSENQLINLWFSSIVDPLTSAPSGYYPIINPQNSFIQVFTKASPINLDSFNDTEAFSNPSSPNQLLQAEQFARLVNRNNAVANIESAYWNILNSSVALPFNDPTGEAATRAAYDFLYTNVSIIDPLTNQTTYTIQKSAIYKRYLELLAEYNAALTAYNNAYNTMSPDEWYINSPAYQANLSDAQQEFNAVSPRVENALNTIATSGGSLSATMLADDQAGFTLTAFGSVLPGNGSFHVVLAQPPDWASNSGEYTYFNFSTSGSVNTVSDAYTSWSSGGGFSGFYSWSLSTNSMSDFYTPETSGMSVSLKFLLLELQRPWLDDAIFKINGWSIPGQSKGCVSNGGANSAIGFLPSYPTHLLIVKNLNIKASWTANDSAYITNHIASGGRLGFGPFTISGDKYQSGSAVSLNTAAFDGISITSSGAQIVGFVQKIVPFSPQLDGVNAPNTTTPNPSSTATSTSTSAPSMSTSTSVSTLSHTSSATSTTAMNRSLPIFVATAVMAYFFTLAIGSTFNNGALGNL